MYQVYTLTCPLSKSIVYVGLTKKPLHIRLYGHMTTVSSCQTKNKWVKKLKSKSLKPEIEVIDLSESEIHARLLESYWIIQLAAWGFPLMNREHNFTKRKVKSLKCSKRTSIKKLMKMRGKLAVIGTGSRKNLAKALKVDTVTVTRYLKYGDIPEAKLKLIYKFLKANLK